MNTHAASSQAGLASFRPAPQPITIYAAVIEWPAPYEDTDTALILERTPEARARAARQAVQDFAAQVDDVNIDCDLAVIAHLSDEEWLKEVPFYNLPFITTYERTV